MLAGNAVVVTRFCLSFLSCSLLFDLWSSAGLVFSVLAIWRDSKMTLFDVLAVAETCDS